VSSSPCHIAGVRRRFLYKWQSWPVIEDELFDDTEFLSSGVKPPHLDNLFRNSAREPNTQFIMILFQAD
jgi:hypothetical protein